METLNKMWVVEPRHSLMRRMFFPIYGLDQLIFFAATGVLVAIAATLNPKLALYMGVGGYIGAVIVMDITTPSALLLPSHCEQRVVEFFDEAPLLKRIGNRHEWIYAGGRLYRWDSDTLRVTCVSNGVLVTGGNRDLGILLAELRL